MDNASYHNVISPEDKVPKMSMKKDTIIAWLLKHGIDHHSAKTKSDLIELVNASEVSKSEVFSIDKFLKQNGHVALRLPPYTPQLNPIELIWAEMKRRVAEVNTSFKLHDVRKHTIHALENISKEFWRKCEDHVKKIEDMYWTKDGLHFSEQQRVVINLMETSDSE